MPTDPHLRALFDDWYRQVEAHSSLVHFLSPRYPLPPMRGWAISPDFALLLVRELLQRRPSGVLELGTGVSTIVTAYCLERLDCGTRFTAVDHDTRYLEQTRSELRAHGLEARVDLIHAPLTAQEIRGEVWTWYDASALGSGHPVDVLVIDGPPGNVQALARYPALPVLRARLAPGALVLLDDGIRDDEQAIVRRWVEEDPALAVEHPLLEKKGILVRRPERPAAIEGVDRHD